MRNEKLPLPPLSVPAARKLKRLFQVFSPGLSTAPATDLHVTAACDERSIPDKLYGMNTGASSFEELISTARARNAKKAAAAQPQAPSVPQPQRAGAAAQPKQEESRASDGRLATTAAAAASAHAAAVMLQEQGDASDEDCREFSGRPVDSNAQQWASLRSGVHGKGCMQAQSACPRQQVQPQSGCLGQGQHLSAALAGAIRGGCEAEGAWGTAEVPQKAEEGVVFVHAAGQDMPGLQLRNDLGVDEVPDSDQDEQ